MSRSVRRFLLKLHHRIGVAVVVFVIFLVATGVLINHSNSLGWDKQRLASVFWLKLYGVDVSRVESGFAVADHWVSQAGSRLYLDDHPLVECRAPLSGAVAMPVSAGLGSGGVALCEDAVVLFTLSAELIEKIPLTGGRTQGLALQDDVIHARRGDAVVLFDVAAGTWSNANIEAESLAWQQPAALPEAIASRLPFANIPDDLTWERLLLDLHSGRLFGPVGVLVVDLAGILMLVLALTGLWSVMTRKR